MPISSLLQLLAPTRTQAKWLISRFECALRCFHCLGVRIDGIDAPLSFPRSSRTLSFAPPFCLLLSEFTLDQYFTVLSLLAHIQGAMLLLLLMVLPKVLV
jgi:hypothetical protein